MAFFSFGKKDKEQKAAPKTDSKPEALKKEDAPKKAEQPKKVKEVAKPAKAVAKKTVAKKAVSKKPAPKAKKTLPAKVAGRATKILINPIVSEKSTLLQGANQYMFRVAPQADKISIRQAVQDAYGVSVGQVRIQRVKAKKRRFRYKEGRMRSWKKAIVTLEKGDKIDIFSGV
ncbi:50S ribosomal protein L23 [Patescibacteria group bacterium]